MAEMCEAHGQEADFCTVCFQNMLVGRPAITKLAAAPASSPDPPKGKASGGLGHAIAACSHMPDGPLAAMGATNFWVDAGFYPD